MRKLTLKFILIGLALAVIGNSLLAPEALAKRGKKGLSDAEMTQITDTLSNLTKKVYSPSLFSPKDNANLIDIKLKLDTALATGPKPEFAALYYKAGYLYNQREFRDDAIECFQTVIDTFADSPYALKSINELKKMGVKVQSPTAEGGQTGTTP